MKRTRLYLCVNPDGMELATNDFPFKVWDYIIEHTSEKYRETHPIKRYYDNQWMDTIMDTDYGYNGEDYGFDGVELPKGTIKLLTGKELTFDDGYLIYEG